MTLPAVRPQPLVRIPEPFDDPAWLWELKLDGFRALAYIENRECRLVSRNGHVFRRFDALRLALPGEVAAKSAILDGEVVCLADDGRSLFKPLLFRRGRPVFAAFDVLWGRPAGSPAAAPDRAKGAPARAPAERVAARPLRRAP